MGDAFAGVAVGDELPVLEVPVTRTMIVAGAIASRDFQDVHHDPDAAQAKGSEDVFMNILTTNGLVGRFVTDWAGPSARLWRVAIRLGTPNLPGDTMCLSGQVDGVDAQQRRVTLAIEGRNRRGIHVAGDVGVCWE